MTLSRNLFILGFVFAFANAGFIGLGRQGEETNEASESNLTIVEPRMEVTIDLPTVEPRKIEIPSNLKPSFSEKQISRQASTATCNGAAVSLQGTSISNPVLVQSNNYPNKYPNNERCSYSLTVPVSSQVLINAQSLDIECPYDKVQFGFNNDPPVLNLCTSSSSRIFSIAQQTFGYTFKVLFTSDNSITENGFQISIWINSTTATVTTTGTPASTTRPTTPSNTTTRTTTTTTTTLPTTTSRTTTTTATTTTRTTTTTATTTTRTTTTTNKILPPAGTCTCGRWTAGRSSGEVGRIVGGSVAPPHSIPYQVGVWSQRSANPFCGGTLISPNYVLTAAHCLPGFTAKDLRIAVNDVKYTVFNDGEKFINVVSVLSHPSYNKVTNDNDFALLRLATPAPISSTVGIACLPPDVSQAFAGTVMTISGWGTTSSSGNQSPDLKVSTVTGWTNADCNKPYAGSPPITANMICAGSKNFDSDTCQGDSGGPMVATVNNRVTLVGVTSFGTGCAESPYPGVYSRVTAQKSWILANSDAGTCQN